MENFSGTKCTTTEKRLQRAWEETARDIRDKFRLCCHEGGHALFMRRYGSDVNYHGPYIRCDGQPVRGAVSPKGEANFGPFEHAAISIAGPFLVHQITGTAEPEEVMNADLACLERKLNTTTEHFELAKQVGEAAILADVQEPDFLSRLEAEVRAYEQEIFGTDECWQWAWKEYCLEWFRERVAVGNNSLGYLMWLIPDDEKVRLFLHGEERSPGDKVHGCPLEVYPLNPGERAADVVRRWNGMVSAATRAAATDHTGADAKAFAEAMVNYEQPWEDLTGFENWHDESEPTIATETGTA
jgi:hypothetical protein